MGVVVLLGECVRVAIWGGRVVRGTGVKVLLILVFFLLPSISRTITSFYFCDDFDYGDEIRSFMRVDRTIECYTSRHSAIVTFATVAVFAFPIGIPCLMWMLLWSRRSDICTRATRDGDASLDSLSFLFQGYSRRLYYMGIVDMLRRLSMGCFLLFFEKHDQVLVGFVITTGFIVSSREMQVRKL